jgi:hypothetical protein
MAGVIGIGCWILLFSLGNEEVSLGDPLFWCVQGLVLVGNAGLAYVFFTVLFRKMRRF